jgi:hypothetical protein
MLCRDLLATLAQCILSRHEPSVAKFARPRVQKIR